MSARGTALRAGVLALALFPVAALFALALPRAGEEFPHDQHEGLFPLCTGCHLGVESGVAAAVFPAPATCEGCHDGVDYALVGFTPPLPVSSNLTFDHQVHARSVAALEEPAVSCQTCHAEPGQGRMAVDPLSAGRCLGCHGPPDGDHFGDAPCATCHVPLASSGLPLERIVAFDAPDDHGSDAFLAEVHGPLAALETARCATCHTRDVCVSCHVDAGRPEIVALDPAPPGMEVPPVEPTYPVPSSHRDPRFRVGHGEALTAAGAASCATCHTRDDCASCHLAPLPAAAATLPARASVIAPGVGLFEGAPDTHGMPRFDRAHGALAAADPGSCATCHTEPFCAQCHQAPQQPVFHPPDFVARHAVDAWSRTTECATCHQVQAFCRSCHVDIGFGAEGRLGPGFHDAERFWLLRHGQPARQSLETCASCHQQRDCVQCHSQLGAFKVNPHGTGFDARGAWEANPRTCLACHVGRPVGILPTP